MIRKLLTYFVIYIAMLLCIYMTACIANNTFNRELFTEKTHTGTAIFFFAVTIAWILMSGHIYWQEKCED